MIEKIKIQMLNLDSEHPFLSSDYFKFFNYSFHRDFKRYLDKTKFYKYLIFNEYEKINSRRSDAISMNREIFLQICNHRKIDTSEFINAYFKYHTDKVRKSTEYFPNLKKGANHTLLMYNRPAGKYYSHSLNTLNLSEAILDDPFDVYKFCVTELKWKHSAYRADIVDGFFSRGKENVPFLSFDSTDSDYRLSYHNLLKLILEKYPLNENQKYLLNNYIECIKSLIQKVIAIEHKKRFYREKALSIKAKKVSIFIDVKMLKAALREGSKLFHPDKNPKGLQLFKEFNTHYMKRDLNKMNLMIKQYYDSINEPNRNKL